MSLRGYKLLGVDYGRKQVGVALTDTSGRFASPCVVLLNDKDLLPALLALCEREAVSRIIIGESRDLKGEPNPIMGRIDDFRERLEQAGAPPVSYEPEIFTSIEATRSPGGGADRVPEDGLSHARAAALILKSYIDRHDNNR